MGIGCICAALVKVPMNLWQVEWTSSSWFPESFQELLFEIDKGHFKFHIVTDYSELKRVC